MVHLKDEKIGAGKGFIALQIHDGGGIKVRWKNMMIKELKYDYSSWSLRDAAGTGKDADPVIMKAREILEATKLELEHLGVPKEEDENLKIWSLLEEEMTGKQIREIKEVLQSTDKEKMEKIANILYNLEKESMAVVLAKLLVP